MLGQEHGMVLIVDDNEIVRQMVHTVFKQLGFSKIVESENGADALVQIEKAATFGTSLRVVISDMDMPMMNGLVLLSRVREHSTGKDMPFIFLTGHGEKELVQSAIHQGATGYIIKPFSLKLLEEEIRKTLKLVKNLD